MNNFLPLINEFVDKRVIFESWYQDILPHLNGIVFYGSSAKGTNRPDSDIDLLFILPLEIEEKYTNGEYFIEYNGYEFNIVMRSIEKLRKIAFGEYDQFQAEIFRSSIVINEKGQLLSNLISKITKNS